MIHSFLLGIFHVFKGMCIKNPVYMKMVLVVRGGSLPQPLNLSTFIYLLTEEEITSLRPLQTVFTDLYV